MDLHPRTVHIRSGLTALAARQLGLNQVTAALALAGIDYFVVPGEENCASAVAVDHAQRPHAIAALQGACKATAAYAQQLVPKPERRRTPRAGDRDETWSALSGADVIRLTWYQSDPAGCLVYDTDYGCDVEFWRRDGLGFLVAPRANRVVPSVPAESVTATVSGARFTRLASTSTILPEVRTRPEFLVTAEDDIAFPIDVVYTWVDGADPDWQRRHALYAGTPYHPEAANAARYLNRDELRYSLRSLHMFAPWVRRVFVVTDGQVPSWLAGAPDNLQVVRHAEIFEDPEALPTFSSRAIETQLHHIEGLSEHFLYLNDDMFLARPVSPQLFFTGNGLSKFFQSKNRIPPGEASVHVTPVQAGAMNNRRLIERRFGRTITRTMQHVPYPLQRSVLSDIEKDFPEEHRATMRSRLRDLHTITVASSLHHYYAYYTGRAVPGEVRYGYVRFDNPDLETHLHRFLAQRNFDTLCMNDSVSTPKEAARQSRVVVPFLESYFPTPSPYEWGPAGGAAPAAAGRGERV